MIEILLLKFYRFIHIYRFILLKIVIFKFYKFCQRWLVLGLYSLYIYRFIHLSIYLYLSIYTYLSISLFIYLCNHLWDVLWLLSSNKIKPGVIIKQPPPPLKLQKFVEYKADCPIKWKSFFVICVFFISFKTEKMYYPFFKS